MLLGPVVKAMLEEGGAEMMVDLVLGEGNIVPSVISRIDVEQGDRLAKGAVYAVKVEFLDKQEKAKAAQDELQSTT